MMMSTQAAGCVGVTAHSCVGTQKRCAAGEGEGCSRVDTGVLPRRQRRAAGWMQSSSHTDEVRSCEGGMQQMKRLCCHLGTGVQ